MKRKIVIILLITMTLSTFSGCKNPLDNVFKKKEQNKEEMIFDANNYRGEETSGDQVGDGTGLQGEEKARVDFVNINQSCYLEVPSNAVTKINYPEKDEEDNLLKAEEMSWIPKGMFDGAVIGPENQRVFIGIGDKRDVDSIKMSAEKFCSSAEGETLGLKGKTVKTESLKSNESETAFYDELTGLDKTPALAKKKTKVIRVVDGANILASLGAYYESDSIYVFAMPIDPLENSEAWSGSIGMSGIHQAINYIGDVLSDTDTNLNNGDEEAPDESDTIGLGNKTTENGVNEPEKRLKHIEKYPSLHEFKYDGKTIKMANDKMIEFDRKKTSEGFNKPVSESTTSGTDTGASNTKEEIQSGGGLENPFDNSNKSSEEKEEETVFSGATEVIKDGKLNVAFSTPSAGGSVMAGKKGNKIIFKLSNNTTVEAEIATKSKLDSAGNNYKYVSTKDGYKIVKKYKSKETLNISGRTMEFYEVEIRDPQREETFKRVSVGGYPLTDENGSKYLILTIKNVGVEDLVEVTTWKDCLANIASSGFKVQ